MNIIDILVLAVLGFSLFAGMHKGFIASTLSLAGMVASWFGARELYGILADYALGNSTFMGILSTYLEPASFFEGMQVSGVGAQTAVSELVAKGTDAVNGVADFIGAKIPFLRDALAKNISSEAFAELNLSTVAEYFDQTLWQAVFNVLAFIIAFFVLYFVANLFINLINHVVRFPLVRRVDWLLGGVLGLVRGAVISILLLAVLEPVLTAFSVEMMNTLRDGSRTYAVLIERGGLDFLQVRGWINQLVLNLKA